MKKIGKNIVVLPFFCFTLLVSYLNAAQDDRVVKNYLGSLFSSNDILFINADYYLQCSDDLINRIVTYLNNHNINTPLKDHLNGKKNLTKQQLKTIVASYGINEKSHHLYSIIMPMINDCCDYVVKDRAIFVVPVQKPEGQSLKTQKNLKDDKTNSSSKINSLVPVQKESWLNVKQFIALCVVVYGLYKLYKHPKILFVCMQFVKKKFLYS